MGERTSVCVERCLRAIVVKLRSFEDEKWHCEWSHRAERGSFSEITCETRETEVVYVEGISEASPSRHSFPFNESQANAVFHLPTKSSCEVEEFLSHHQMNDELSVGKLIRKSRIGENRQR